MRAVAVIKDARGRVTKSDPTFATAFLMLSSRRPNQGAAADRELARVIVRQLGGEPDPFSNWAQQLMYGATLPLPDDAEASARRLRTLLEYYRPVFAPARPTIIDVTGI